MAVDVVDNVERSRFEVHVDGKLAGLADYRLRGSTIAFTHTEVAADFEGQGLAGTMVRHALDASRDTGLRVVPLCSYVASYIERHPEYQDLLEAAPE
ncbi:GNAT family N-acetyltransferase [Nonomuraea indica]|uniref:GNAT family N-acetyltransferase n=1 Tax=Nonomuraea indica TaxID=1581193 RepID=A0ABW8ACK3_9ACTN